ncbi:histone acetyltransferase p300-like isoform X6 [Macrosteles quadrilineatus]|uniref:histone acetyltransferase p300-like isoform X6 n=1 Tax=Macrosteles quadrilineatus TaxID=74068 RepID=UPI0023E1ADA1|nr:histone acetyltransferase p300-like isoform X6 [Macrosteles quadrilineatus]
MEVRPTLALATLICWIGLVSAPLEDGTLTSDDLLGMPGVIVSNRKGRLEDMVPPCSGGRCSVQVVRAPQNQQQVVRAPQNQQQGWIGFGTLPIRKVFSYGQSVAGYPIRVLSSVRTFPQSSVLSGLLNGGSANTATTYPPATSAYPIGTPYNPLLSTSFGFGNRGSDVPTSYPSRTPSNLPHSTSTGYGGTDSYAMPIYSTYSRGTTPPSPQPQLTKQPSSFRFPWAQQPSPQPQLTKQPSSFRLPWAQQDKPMEPSTPSSNRPLWGPTKLAQDKPATAVPSTPLPGSTSSGGSREQSYPNPEPTRQRQYQTGKPAGGSNFGSFRSSGGGKQEEQTSTAATTPDQGVLSTQAEKLAEAILRNVKTLNRNQISSLVSSRTLTEKLMDLCTETMDEQNTMEILRALKKQDPSLIKVYYPVREEVKSKVIQHLVDQGLRGDCSDPFVTGFWEIIRTKLVLLKLKQQ